jgi:hypothetical protein
MPMRRRTINITDLIDEVNRVNRESRGAFGPQQRMGSNMLLESVLTFADVHSGFGYLTQREVPPGELPGIVKGDGVVPDQFPDESRRIYYTHLFLTRK